MRLRRFLIMEPTKTSQSFSALLGNSQKSSRLRQVAQPGNPAELWPEDAAT